MTEGANISDAIFELKEHNLSLVHILIAAPWRYLENESSHGNKSPNRNGSPHRNESPHKNESPHRNKSPDSPHGNESLHVNESVITNRIDSDCRDCLSYLSKYSRSVVASGIHVIIFVDHYLLFFSLVKYSNNW